MKISENGIELIKSFESFAAEPYLCPAGYWTIGYGHVIKRDEEFDIIDEDEAVELLMKDLISREDSVNRLVTVDINQNQFDALVSLVYNIGANAFLTSTLLKKLNSEDFEGAANEFLRWNKGGGRVLKGLTRRREAEKELFES